jgi:hypothetical protein
MTSTTIQLFSQNLKNILQMSFRQKKSHYDYHPLPREEGEPDAMETIKLLPQAPREKLLHIFDEGTLRPGDLDHKSVMTLQQLSEPLQV